MWLHNDDDVECHKYLTGCQVLDGYHSCPVQQPVTRKLFLIITKKLVGAFVVEQVL